MASRNFKEKILNLETGFVLLAGKIAIASDASVSSTTGQGFTVAKTGTGAYTITLSDAYTSVISLSANVLAATAVDLVPQFVSADPTSAAKTVVIKLLAAATATNPSAACELHFQLMLKNSSVY